MESRLPETGEVVLREVKHWWGGEVVVGAEEALNGDLQGAVGIVREG